MSDRTAIGWTDATWNPIVGCTRVSDGCLNCYAMRDARRMAGNPHPKIGQVYQGLVGTHPDGSLDWTGEVRCLPERLRWPFRWKQPRRVFVCSQSDLFHPEVPDEFRDQVFAVVALNQHHTFQVLTKRPERAVLYFSKQWLPPHSAGVVRSEDRQDHVVKAAWLFADGDNPQHWTAEGEILVRANWPLPNVWIGVTVEDQQAADERIPLLFRIPAVVRFVSAEPLLGSINLRKWLGNGWDERNWQNREELIDWCIAGCESGPRARLADPDWFRSLRDQCQAAGVPFFHKQQVVTGKLVREPKLDGSQHLACPEVRR